MEVFGFGTDEPSRPLLPPGLCWLCDNAPQQEGMKVIDTRRNSRPGQSALDVSERKYVCEGCAREMGEAIGMVDPRQHASVVESLADARSQAMHLQARLDEAESSQMRVVAVDEVLANMKPAPRKAASAS